jgi:hypothetical protein
VGLAALERKSVMTTNAELRAAAIRITNRVARPGDVDRCVIHVLATVHPDASDEQMRQDNESLRSEVDRLIQLGRKQAEEIERLNDMVDAVEVLRDIGNVIGCDHVDGPDERRQLVNCLEQEFARVNYELDRKLTVPVDDSEPVTREIVARNWHPTPLEGSPQWWWINDRVFLCCDDMGLWTACTPDSRSDSWHPFAVLMTVNDLRRLCDLLGVELKGGAE